MSQRRQGKNKQGGGNLETPRATDAESRNVIFSADLPVIEEIDPRLVAIVRALARQAARDYLQQQSGDTGSRRLAPYSDGEES